MMSTMLCLLEIISKLFKNAHEVELNNLKWSLALCDVTFNYDNVACTHVLKILRHNFKPFLKYLSSQVVCFWTSEIGQVVWSIVRNRGEHSNINSLSALTLSRTQTLHGQVVVTF